MCRIGKYNTLTAIDLLFKRKNAARNLGFLYLEKKPLRLGYSNLLPSDIFLGGKYLFELLNSVILASKQ
jgi:hypothetical protein